MLYLRALIGRLFSYGYNSKMEEKQKPLLWVASSKKDLKALPEDVQDVFGYALHLAQEGKKHDQAKPLKGFGGAGVLEVSLRISKAMRTGQSTQSNLAALFMFCTAFRRNRRMALKRPNLMWT